MIKLPKHVIFFAEGEELLHLYSLTLHLLVSFLKFLIEFLGFILPLLGEVLDFRFQVHLLFMLLLQFIHANILRIFGLLFHFLFLFVVLQYDLVHGLPLALTQYGLLRRLDRVQLLIVLFRIIDLFFVFSFPFHVCLLNLALDIIHLEANRLGICCTPHVLIRSAGKARLAQVPTIRYLFSRPGESATNTLFLECFIETDGLIQITFILLVVVYFGLTLQKDIVQESLSIFGCLCHF